MARRWTLHLLADRRVAWTRLEGLSYEAVHLVLKNDLKPWQRQKRRTPTVIGTWESEWNAARATIDWRLKIPNARDKLKKLYPVKEE